MISIPVSSAASFSYFSGDSEPNNLLNLLFGWLIPRDHVVTPAEEASHIVEDLPAGESFINLQGTCDVVDGICDTGAGENSANCCWDCPCPTVPNVQYCDGSVPPGTCRLESIIDLTYVSPNVVPPVNICTGSASFDAVVRLENPPAVILTTDTTYRLNDGFPTATTCIDLGSNEFSCTVIIPQDNNACQGGQLPDITQNTLTFDITFKDDERIPRARSMTVDLPDIPINSFTIGDDVCESDLGENSDNSCWDCPCDQNFYCDGPTDASDFQCKTSLSNTNLVISNPDPSSVDEHDPASGDNINFQYTISNFPEQPLATVTGEACSGAVCTSPDGSCTAQCTLISCVGGTVQNGNFVNKCTVNIRIDNHNPEFSYVVTPNISLDVSVPQPSSQAQVFGLSKLFQQGVTFGPFFCGDGEVSSDENQNNCCTDTGCGPSFYCDGFPSDFPMNSCLPENAIAFGPITPSSIPPVNLCQDNFEYKAVVNINNAPSGMTLISTSYTLGNGFSGPATCSQMPSGEYNCTILIPQNSSTCGGESSPDISPNTLKFDINFPNGSSGLIFKQLTGSLPLIRVSTSDIGNGNCEADLGENSDNACYDCGCDFGQYCDGTGSPESWSCRNNITGFNLQLGSVRPNSFTDHNPAGNEVRFDYTVTNWPSQDTIAAQNERCSDLDCHFIDPSTGFRENCVASCVGDISCGFSEVDGGKLVRESCSLKVVIDDHNQDFSYELEPEISVDVVNLFDGPRALNTITMTGNLQSINFGTFFCGDGVQNTGETSANCCFDVACSAGEFCDSALTSGKTEEDVCRSESNIQLTSSVSPTSFDDSSISHTAFIDATITNKPRGITASLDNLECEFGNGREVVCEIIDCEEPVITSDDYSFSCEIRIPPVDFRTSDFFEASQGGVVLPGSISLPITFNNGSSTISRTLEDNFGEITISVQSTCPDGIADFDEEFGQANECPADTGCSDGQFLIVENSGDRGVCVEESSLGLQITSITPNPVPCIVNLDGFDINDFKGGDLISRIQALGDVQCHPDPMNIIAKISGAPSSVEVVSSSYTIDGNSFDISCTRNRRGGVEYKCPVTLAETNKSNLLGTMSADENIDLIFDVQFNSKSSDQREVLVSRTISASSSFSMNQELSQPVEELLACYQEIQRIDKKKKDLENKKKALLTIVGVMAAITTAACIKCKLGGGTIFPQAPGAAPPPATGAAAPIDSLEIAQELLEDFDDIINFGGIQDNENEYSSLISFQETPSAGDAAAGDVATPEGGPELSEKDSTLSCKICRLGIPLTACVSTGLLWAVGSTADKIKDLNDDKKEACAATQLIGLSGSSKSSGATLAKIGAVVAGVVCVIGVAKGLQHLQTFSQNPGAAEGAAPPAAVADSPTGPQ